MPYHTPKRIYTIEEFKRAFNINVLRLVSNKSIYADGQYIGSVDRFDYDPNGTEIRIYEWEYTDETGQENHYITMKRY